MAKRSRKVDLRAAYSMGGYYGDYAKFVREKVIPIIGETALHKKASKDGSRVREYLVTQRNFHRVTKSLGISTDLSRVEKAVSNAGSKATAELILKLIRETSQPTADPNFPIGFRIPIHPISHNRQYKAVGGRIVRSKVYTNWRRKFFALIQEIVSISSADVDFSKPVEVSLHFGHMEESDPGKFFDLQNFCKSALDCSFEHYGSPDHLIRSLQVSGEFVNDYADGFIEVKMRNL